MNKGKGLSLLLLASILALSACSKGNEKESTSTPGSGSPALSQKDETADKDLYKMKEPLNVSYVLRVKPDLKLPEGNTVENNMFTRHIAEQMNINFKVLWYASNTDYDQKAKLSIASNDIPDAMVVDEKQFRAMAEGGQLEDLTEVYKKYATDQVKKYYDTTEGRALKQATINGKLLALPNIVPQADPYVLTWVRKDWLDKLGLPEPKTLEDVEKITEAFIKNDPDGNGKADTVGLTGNNSTVTQWYGHDFRAVFNVYNAHPGIWYTDSTGKLVYGSTTPEAKLALTKSRELYAKGLVDKEFATRKDPQQLVNDSKVGLFFQAWWEPFQLGDAIKNDPKADWKAYALTGVNGKHNVSMVATSSAFLVVKKGFKQPEAMVKYVNFQTRFGKTPTESDLKIDHVQYTDIMPLPLNIDYPNTATDKHDMLVQAL
ncbi:ABC transporter substrate-binding protein, partial [Paenibacillus sp. TAF58]